MTRYYRSTRWSSVVAVAFLVSVSICSGSLLAGATPLPLILRGGGSGMVLRVRLADGSMERVQLEEGTEERLTLGDVLKPLGVSSDASVRIGSTTVTNQSDEEKSNLKALEVRHGSLLTVLPSEKASSSSPPVASRFAGRKKASSAREWDPYPELAKDYDAVVLQSRTKRSSRQGMSYTDISKIQSALHVVDPQKEGPVKRLYMCRVSAERFYSNGVVPAKKKSSKAAASSSSFACRFGLLLGTISRERVDRRPKKARTSLSSTTADSEFCTAAKVQAVWEPPGQQPASDTLYDASKASSLLSKHPRVLAIARYLGLAPVGWIFSYRDDRLEEGNSFGTDGPQALLGLDVAVGGNLKAGAMREKHSLLQTANDEDGDDLDPKGHNFVTLAMDATTGATEAFQLSDVAVQMVHEDLFEALLAPLEEGGTAKPTNPARVPMRHPVLVDGRETEVLDSVLCLVNTAVLSHVGSYSGKSGGGNSVKKASGGLTLGAKKRLLKALESADASDFLQEVCDFGVLVALDELLSSTSTASTKNKKKSSSTKPTSDDDMKKLCGLVRKWARGQKKGTRIDPKFKMKLQTYLS